MSTWTSPSVVEKPARTLFGHPMGLYVLFSTELWERFSFYSMRAFLVLYLTKALLMADQISNEIYGAYLGFVYAAPFFGGMLADRLLGQRRAIVIGGLLLAAAQFSLATHSVLLSGGESAGSFAMQALFFVALGLIAAGNGFFKPNISTIVGSLYEQGDPRRDSAFTIFYMGINVGAFLAGFSGQLAQKIAWHWGFLLAGIGMLLSLIILGLGRGQLQNKGLPPNPQAMRQPWHFGIPKSLALAVAVIIFVPVAAAFIAHPRYVQGLALIVSVPILGYLIWEATRGTREEAGRMIVIIVLCSFSMMFWGAFELAGSAINLFTDRQVHLPTLPLLGRLESSLLTAQINPLLIVLMAVFFTMLWTWLGRMHMEPSSPLKFSLGLMQLAAGFLVLYLGAVQAGNGGRCSVWYLVLGFVLHTTGELCLSPVGLSTITKLSPARLVGTFMGVWFLSSSVGNILFGFVAGKTEHYGFKTVFLWIAILEVAAGVLLFSLTPLLKRLMHGVR